MNEQFTMPGFEKPSAKEQAVYEAIEPALKAAATAMGGAPEKIRFQALTNYSSVYFDTILSFRIRIRGSAHFVEVPLSSRATVSGLAPMEHQKSVGDFWRVRLTAKEMVQQGAVFGAVLRDAINRTPKEWDCCSRYLECSDARKCVHPDPSFALACGYRKILASGKIYYGGNRNIE